METSTITSSTETSSLEAIRKLIEAGTLRHVAIIMDGNRRWAKNKILPSPQGHYNGYQALKKIVRFCSEDLHLPALTVYAFSTENWRRSAQEVDFLLKLFQQSLQNELQDMIQKNLQVRFLGDLAGFSESFQKECHRAEALTANNTGMIYQIALNYGARAELLQAFQQIAGRVQAGELTPNEITEDLVAQHLYTGTVPDPDILIRTGGEYRLSNFLLWQTAYSEIYVTPTHWPEFTPECLIEALTEFQNRQRRFGK